MRLLFVCKAAEEARRLPRESDMWVTGSRHSNLGQGGNRNLFVNLFLKDGVPGREGGGGAEVLYVSAKVDERTTDMEQTEKGHCNSLHKSSQKVLSFSVESRHDARIV